MNTNPGNMSGLQKVDYWISRVARWFSTLGGIALTVMGVILFVNIVAAKGFGHALNNVNELVDYLLIAVVYCCAATCQLNGDGLIQVDIFYRKFPPALQKAIKGLGFLLGAFLYGFAGYKAFTLLRKYYTAKTLAAQSTTSFVIWPFALLYIIGTFALALALLWSVVRVTALDMAPPPKGDSLIDLKQTVETKRDAKLEKEGKK